MEHTADSARPKKFEDTTYSHERVRIFGFNYLEISILAAIGFFIAFPGTITVIRSIILWVFRLMTGSVVGMVIITAIIALIIYSFYRIYNHMLLSRKLTAEIKTDN